VNLSNLHSDFCKDLDVQYHIIGDREFLSSRFQYSDGDLICAYLDKKDDQFVFTDRGNTMHRFKISGFELGQSRVDLVRMLLASYNVDIDGGRITKIANEDNVRSAYIDFCVAIEKVSSLEIQFRHRRPNYLKEMMDHLVNDQIEPYRQVQRSWCDELIDPSFAYPIDYHFNSVGVSRNLFTVSSREKGLLVSAVSNFLRAHDKYSPTMAVFDSELNLSRRHVDRVRESVDEVVFGLSGCENRVVDFALSTNNL
tara:strand:- start:94 stop:855 length:762 start_codon:yes stop_codon:yes gene_type:complete